MIFLKVFSTRFSPLTAGRRRHAHRLRWLPVGGPPLGDFFFTKWIKINDFNVKIIIFKCFQWVFLSDIFNKYCCFRENSFFWSNLIKKFFDQKKFFLIFFPKIFFHRKNRFFESKIWNSNSEVTVEFKNDVIVRLLSLYDNFWKSSMFRRVDYST